MARKQIDARTKTMSAVALTCRALKHGMVEKPVPRSRELELRRLGQYEIRMVCFRGCGRFRSQICDEETDEVIGTTGGYTDPQTYLVQERGTGRLSPAAARAAYRKRMRSKKS